MLLPDQKHSNHQKDGQQMRPKTLRDVCQPTMEIDLPHSVIQFLRQQILLREKLPSNKFPISQSASRNRISPLFDHLYSQLPGPLSPHSRPSERRLKSKVAMAMLLLQGALPLASDLRQMTFPIKARPSEFQLGLVQSVGRPPSDKQVLPLCVGLQIEDHP